MRLNKDEIKLLLNIGYTEEDIEQIKRSKYKLVEYEVMPKKITQREAKQKLDTTSFLSEIGRATFHKTAMRDNILIERI